MLLHVVTGVAATMMMAPVLWRSLRRATFLSRLGWGLLGAGTLLGLILIYTGTTRIYWNWLYLHIVLCFAGVGLLVAQWAGKRGWLHAGRSAGLTRAAVCLTVLAGLGSTAWYLRNARWQHNARIENPVMPPASMDGEGDGPNGPFFPSSAQVAGGSHIPGEFFMESDSCRRCHADIYKQWYRTFTSFVAALSCGTVQNGPTPAQWLMVGANR